MSAGLNRSPGGDTAALTRSVAAWSEPQLGSLASLLGDTASKRDWGAVKRALAALPRSELDPAGDIHHLLGVGLAERTTRYARASTHVPEAQRPPVCVAAALIEGALEAQQAPGPIAPFELLLTDFMLAHSCSLLATGADPSRQTSFSRVIEWTAAKLVAGTREQDLRARLVAAMAGDARPRRDRGRLPLDGDGGAELIERELAYTLARDPPAVGRPMSRLVGAGGKRLRPRLALAAGRASGSVPEDALSYAVSIELVHSATLVHDDYIDGSLVRRNLPTVAAAEGSQAAIGVGTYYFARAARGVAEIGSPALAGTFSSALRALCLSQLDELCQRGSYPGDRRSYMLVVRGKTAALFAAASAGGAQCADLPPATVVLMKRYGELLGIAFQMVDDLIDFSDESGKPLGQDIRDRTVSLPLSYALEDERAGPELLELLNAPPDKLDVRRAVALVGATDALARVRAEAQRHAERAVQVLVRRGLDRERSELVALAHAAVARTA
jgi:geranylgeranyl pyrophosphate synthase